MVSQILAELSVVTQIWQICGRLLLVEHKTFFGVLFDLFKQILSLVVTALRRVNSKGSLGIKCDIWKLPFKTQLVN